MGTRFPRHDGRPGIGPSQRSRQPFAAFARHLADSPLSDTPLSALSDLVLENLARFAATPTREEAAAYGAFRDAEDQNDSYNHALAAPYSPLAALRVRFGRHGYHHNEWQAGSLRLSSDLMRRMAAPDIAPIESAGSHRAERRDASGRLRPAGGAL